MNLSSTRTSTESIIPNWFTEPYNHETVDFFNDVNELINGTNLDLIEIIFEYMIGNVIGKDIFDRLTDNSLLY